MDLETFETIEVKISEDVLQDIEENRNVEYWNVDNKKIIKRLA